MAESMFDFDLKDVDRIGPKTKEKLIAGGHVIAHTCTYRIYLKKAGQERVATIVDSPCHPYGDTRFQLTEKGVVDVESPRKIRN